MKPKIETKQNFNWIPFQPVACSSEEKGTSIENLSYTQMSTVKSWESSKTGEFPVEIVFRLNMRAELSYIVIASKKEKVIPECQFQIGDGLAGSFLDVEYRNAG